MTKMVRFSFLKKKPVIIFLQNLLSQQKRRYFDNPSKYASLHLDSALNRCCCFRVDVVIVVVIVTVVVVAVVVVFVLVAVL